MAAIKPLDQISAKWATVTPGRATEYQKGVQAPRSDWAESTIAAHDRYAAGVTAAVAARSQQKGVQTAGSQKWLRGALAKGVDRYGPGVQAAQADYARAFAPYRDAIQAVTLPQRFARRDQRNLARVAAVVSALIQVKKQLGGA